MGNISRALALADIGDYRNAAATLRSQLGDVEASAEWIGLCEWIGACFERLGELPEAAGWYESAGMMLLADESVPLIRRSSEALHFFEKATECHRRGGERELAMRAAAVLHKLERYCLPA